MIFWKRPKPVFRVGDIVRHKFSAFVYGDRHGDIRRRRFRSGTWFYLVCSDPAYASICTKWYSEQALSPVYTSEEERAMSELMR